MVVQEAANGDALNVRSRVHVSICGCTGGVMMAQDRKEPIDIRCDNQSYITVAKKTSTSDSTTYEISWNKV